MAELRAPEQNRLLGQLANMLRATEGDIAAPEFLPRGLDVMGLVRQLMLPSAETVEKLSYGDPLFRMPTQSNIPITADREYLADIAGMIPFGAPAARPSARAMQDLVRQIQTEPPTGAISPEIAARVLPDTKVVDETGKPLVVYHGTPDAFESSIRGESYFSPDPEIAGIYTSPTASSIATFAKRGDAPAVYPSYLEIKKPFDTRDPKIRKEFMEEYYGKYGNMTPLSDSGLPDWTEARDLREWIEETGKNYDGLILDEGGIPMPDGTVKSRGISYVPFESSQIKSAVSDPQMAGLLDQPAQMAPSSVPRSDMGFYSQLESAVQPLQNKGTGQQYLAQIQKSAGVKPEEIQWTGLDTFLQGRQSVTKAEIQDYLNANRVDVQEVRLSDQIDPEDVRAYMEDEAGYGLTYEEALDDLRTGEPSTRFSSYTLPGGENYREILLTLPQKGSVDVKAAEQTRDTLARQTADLMEEWKRLSEEMPGDPRVVELYGRLSETRRARDQAVVDARELRKSAESQTYRSSHFDQPNILAHLRVNDRTVDGKKTLFVEEIQSDWHQAGRKRGYQGQTRSVEQIDKELDSVVNELRSMPGVAYAPSAEDWARYPEITARHDALVAERASAGSSRDFVPDAPFKTSWHELSLKRAIQEAAEKGYDQIAFTTGKTQAERYDLSKQVDAINYQKHKDGTFSLGVKGKNQVTFENNIGGTNLQNIPEEELSSVVGKDLAEKMIAGEGRRVGQTPTRVFEGLDLSVGGKGMEGFYDNILPKSLDKLGKKFGAKVGKTFIEGERTRDADGFPSMYPEKIEVWKMDITPQMRESVTTKGQPLFAIPAIGAGLLGAGMMQEEEQF